MSADIIYGAKWVGGFWLLTAAALAGEWAFFAYCPDAAYHLGAFLNWLTGAL